MSFPAYADYRDSNVGWLGDLPAHWKAMRFSRVVAIAEGQVDPRVEPYASMVLIAPNHVEGGTGRLVALETAADQGADSGKYQFATGEVIYSKIRPALAKVVLAPCDGLCSADMYPLRGVEGLASPYLKWVLLCPEFTAWAVLESDRVAMPKINREKLNEFRLPVPSRTEQVAIAAFLDRETAKIDALVEAQRQLIELLKEKRQAIIAHSVTKGLDPSAPMKDSGVEWLGQVPAHWEVSQSRRMFGVRSEPALPDDQMLTASQKYGVLFQVDFVEREGRRVVEVIMGKDSLRHVEPDDFIISMRSFQGGLEWSLLRGSTSFHYVMVTPIKWVHPPFFAHLFKSTSYIQALRATTDLIRDGQEIRYSHFVKVPLPVIPIEEQKHIAEVLGAEVGRYDALLVEAEEHITLLQERRAALISAAVTGKIDVRGLVQTAEAA